MKQTLTVERVVPWPQFNEYEGQIEGRLDGHPVTCHVWVDDRNWDGIRAGDALAVAAMVRRTGDVEVLDAAAPAELRQLDGVNYAVVGTVLERDGERVRLDSVMPMDVDLELSPFLQRTIPDVKVGDRIRIEGSLEADLDPDDEDEG
jgi:hypothetical protein